jgi:hypothetical protein
MGKGKELLAISYQLSAGQTTGTLARFRGGAARGNPNVEIRMTKEARMTE